MGHGIFFAITFYLTAAIAVASALMVIWHRNPVINALYLVLCLFAVAVDYVLLHAHFLAVIQILLYAGAVLVLFLMIIMLLNLAEEEKEKSKPTMGKAIGVAAVFALVIMLTTTLAGVKAIPLAAQDPVKLASFLISLGEKPVTMPTEAELEGAKKITPADQLNLARDVLRAMLDPEAQAYLKLPPDIENDLTKEKLNDLLKTLATATAGLEDVNQLKPPSEYPRFNGGQMLTLVKAAARGRLTQFRELGTTEAVGMALFQRWLLPFEVSGLLLLSAIVGVIFLARRTRDGGIG
jgi:NADH-quinone oxidoreductase subunit J